MKYFVATDVSDEIKEYIQELQSLIPEDSGTFSFTPRNHPHITLKFLGAVEEDKIKDVKKKLERVKYTCFTVTSERIGFFPNNHYVKVFWLGLQESEELSGLAKEVRKHLPEFRGGYPFSAHITIARVKNLSNKKAFFEAIEKIKVKQVTFGIDSFKLMRSVPTDNGHRHELVEKYNCG